MREYDHTGLPTDEKQPVEMWVEATRVWVTDPMAHPYKVEYLRYEPDSPVIGPVRDQPHMAFRVDNLDEAMAGCEVLLGPFNATDSLRVVFVLKDGAVFEFMENAQGGEWFKA
jgi:hypothetical protein